MLNCTQAAFASYSNAPGSHTQEQPLQREASQMDEDMQPAATADMDVDADVPPPIQEFTRTGRPRRNYRLPRRFQDFLPEPASPAERDAEIGSIRRVVLIVRDRLITVANSFGIWRDYP